MMYLRDVELLQPWQDGRPCFRLLG